MTPQILIDKAIALIDKHLDQIRIHATHLTDKGPRGFRPDDSQVIERYTKILMALQKGENAPADEYDTMTDEQLQAEALKALGEANATETSES